MKVRRSFEEAELEAMMAAEAQKRTTKETSKVNIGKSTQVSISLIDILLEMKAIGLQKKENHVNFISYSSQQPNISLNPQLYHNHHHL